MRRRLLLVLAALAPLAAGAARAQPAPAAPIEALNDGLLRVMRAGKATPFAERAGILLPLVQQAFDLRQILETSVGPRWASFAPDIQAQLLDAFTQFTVASWVANFDSYGGESFQILPALRQVGADEVVQTRLVPASGAPTELDYVMRNDGGAWKAVDILLDGSISRVAVQRSDFRGVLGGGDAGRLIAMLRDKTRSLAAGGRS